MEFQIDINAPRQKVWTTLWDDKTYRAWTSAFAEGSWAKTDWKKGSKALFLGAENSGMVSVIADNKPNEFMSIKHLGTVKDGVENLDAEENKQWAGMLENYTLVDKNGKTSLHISLTGGEMPKEFEDYFQNAWPKALDLLKNLAEKN